jgi:predicted amidophosphoribosyltransferase
MEAEYFCCACGTPFQNRFPLDEEGRCALCRNGLRGFEAAYCYGVYGGVLRRLIHLFKYQKVRSLEGPLADYLLRALPRDGRFDAIVPVPLHWRRRWRRGFNQCELLAREVSRRTGIPVAKALRRPLASKAQAGLTLAARRHNVKIGSFSAAANVAGTKHTAAGRRFDHGVDCDRVRAGAETGRCGSCVGVDGGAGGPAMASGA